MIRTATVISFLAGLILFSGSARSDEDAVNQALAKVHVMGGTWSRDVSRPDVPIVMIDVGGGEVTDADLAILKTFPELEHLSLRNTQVTNGGLKSLQGLTKLKKLELAGLRITDDSLGALGALRELTELDISYTLVTGSGLDSLAGLKKLKVLDMTRTAVTDKSIAGITALTTITDLDLTENEIGDKSLKPFYDLKNLKNLNLTSTYVTDEGVEKLREANKELKVVK